MISFEARLKHTLEFLNIDYVMSCSSEFNEAEFKI